MKELGVVGGENAVYSGGVLVIGCTELALIAIMSNSAVALKWLYYVFKK